MALSSEVRHPINWRVFPLKGRVANLVVVHIAGFGGDFEVTVKRQILIDALDEKESFNQAAPSWCGLPFELKEKTAGIASKEYGIPYRDFNVIHKPLLLMT
jgi:hypothetical protein